ncbi:MAG: hypothetical protein WC353_00665 [Candidatus Peribacter sp.]|jgi:hypothetical protein
MHPLSPEPATIDPAEDFGADRENSRAAQRLAEEKANGGVAPLELDDWRDAIREELADA